MSDEELRVLRIALRWGYRPGYAMLPAWLAARSMVYVSFLELVVANWQRSYHQAGQAGVAAGVLLLIQDAEIRALPEYHRLLAEFSL